MPRFSLNPLSLAISTLIIAPFGAISFHASAQDNSDKIETIMVTAQKSEQSLQEIPDAVSVVEGDALDRLNVANIFDLSDQVPGLVVSSVQGYRPSVSLRGVGNEIPDNAGTKQAVAYHIDDVFMANDYALWADLVDIDRVEITRGPDGTIYGNSSTGGAINVHTKKPEFINGDGFLSSTFGQYDTMNFKGAATLQLDNNVALRLSGSQRKHDGFTENKALTHDFSLDDKNDTTIRAQLRWQPSSNLDLMLQHMQFSSDTNGPALKGNFDIISDDPRVVYHDTREYYRLDMDMTSLHADYDLKWANLRGIFSQQNYDMRRRLDMDRSSLTANDPAPFPLPADGQPVSLGQVPIPEFISNLRQEDESYTAEINLVSPNSSADLTWVVGAFYLDTEIFSNTRNFYDGGRDGNPVNKIVAGPDVFANNADIDFINSDFRNFQSYSVFGQVGYALTEKLRLTSGLRYTNNQFEDERCSLNCVPNRNPITSTPSDETDNVTGKISLDYRFSTQSMGYASVATGIKPAGSNSSTDTRFFPEKFDQEEVLAYELGMKNDWFSNRLRVNTALFYYDYSDYLFESSGIGRFNSGASNLPEAEIYGVEIEAQANLGSGWRLDSNLTWMESEVTKGRDAIDRAEAENASVGLILAGASTEEINAAREATAVDLTGNDLAKIPELVANIRLSYTHLLSNGSSLRTSLGYTHRGDYFARVFNSPERDVVESYDLAHLNVNYTPPQGNWDIELNIRNLFDDDSVASVHTDTFGIGVTSTQYLAPRVTTIQARYYF
ncbi:TonB-dependent receptor [Idiomarina sp.]|uniref:TonB-dependent receptor n=1 Tax=Idiomarina sp. TaxID=1874361 RepID=UPI003A8FA559